MTKSNKGISLIDPSTLTICDDPIPEARKSVGSKYDAIFSKMKPGKAIKCPAGAAARLSGQLRKYVERNGMQCDIKTTDDYGDGFGRVWLLDKTEAPKLRRAA